MSETVAKNKWWGVILRIALFSLASNVAVIAVFAYGQFFWPESLPGWAQHIFWLASGVNVAGLLFLGLRYWPVIVFDAIPAWLILGQPFDRSLIGASLNAIEALFVVWIIRAFGRYLESERPLDGMRPTAALLVASLIAPMATTLLMPTYFVMSGVLPWAEFGRALGNWNLANGGGILLLLPLLWAIRHGRWVWPSRRAEMLCALVAVVFLSVTAFGAAFAGFGLNFTFLVFPVILYVAVRFGWSEVSVVLGVMLVMIYVTLGWDAKALPPEELALVIWYVQAFCWVLAATGFLIAALSTQRREAELRALEEQGRALEAKLHAERTRLAALRYQINPHFLFNALNSIRSSLPMTESVGREMLTDLSSFLRSTLEGDDTELMSVREEIESVEQYLRIEKRRFTTRLVTAFHIDPSVQDRLIPVFLLQPLVENAIRHGLEQSREPCEISLTVRGEEGALFLEVANTGRWQDTPSIRGIGLDNVRRRLALQYGDRASLRIHAEEGIVRVQIRLPL